MNIERPREKRYGWFRLYNGFAGHRKWRMVARAAKVRIAEVEAVAIRLFECANKGKPRGSIAEFSCHECAADLDLDAEAVVAVYKQFEAIGYVDREYLTTWDDRQPDREDTTNAERQARHRGRKRAERGEESNAVTAVTVTPKTETQTDTASSSEELSKIRAIGPGDAVSWGERERWLAEKRSKQRFLPLGPVALKRSGNR